MKQLLILGCLFISLGLIGQSEEETEIKNPINSFFSSFHAQDSVGMASVVSKNVVLQTIGANKQRQQVLRQENFNDLIHAITSIPDSIKFEEKLLDYSIQVDGPMANVWTPYEFWLNNTFSHCGVNSFQLFKQEGQWKIIYLIDTRRREGCVNQPN